MDTQQALVSASLSQSTGVQEILKQYQDVQSQLAVALTRYREGHPTVSRLQRQEAALRALLQQRIGGIIRKQQPISDGDLQVGQTQAQLIENLSNAEVQQIGLRNQLNTLISAQTAYRTRASSLPRLQQQQAELERRLKAAQSTYETLLGRLQEIRVAENQNVGNARVISEATPPTKPASSKKLLYLVAGTVAGALLGTATAFGLELVDQSVKTLKEARELLKYPLLGVIPLFNKVEQRAGEGEDSTTPPIFARDLPRSSIYGSYQMLQANLKFLTSRPLQAITVTSSVPKEGKSTVAANLAATMAQMGRRVLLVDADLRQPYQHHVWNLTNLSGLSNVIVGQTELEAAVLTAGVIPPNPIALLDSQRMVDLIETFNSIYDFVIFDTPPLAGTADAVILGKLMDGVLLVVRPGVVNSTNATAAREYLTQSGQNVLGLVVNGVVVKSEPDSYFYHTRETKTRMGQPISSSKLMPVSTSLNKTDTETRC
jgi:capsular exopolysaccharide synthesis family protein